MDNNTVQYKRKHYFIKRDLQARYALVFVLAIGIGLNIGVVLTVTAPLLHATIPIYPVIFFILAFSFIILVGVTSILFTHKIAGPVFKIEKHMKIISEEFDLTQRVHLRHGDELKDLAEEMNYMCDKIRESIILDNQKARLAMTTIDDLIQNYRDNIPEGKADEFLDGLYFARQQLQQVGDKFKVD